MNRARRAADLVALLPCHLRAQLRIVLHLHLDRCCDLAYQIAGLLLFLAEKRVEKSSLSNLLAQLAMFKKDVYGFPQRVVKDLNHLLVKEYILGESLDGIGAFGTRKSEGQSFSHLGKLKCG